MEKKPLPTQFLPAERVSEEEIQADLSRILKVPLLQKSFDAVPNPVFILNKERQVVFMNREAVGFVESRRGVPQLGLRPGEVLRCDHAKAAPGGCGTSEFCSTCGGAQAIKSSQAGTETVKECRINQELSSEAFDLRVSAAPFDLDGRKFTVYTVADISSEKRRRALERIFFHDILNTAAGMQGCAEMFKDATPEEKEECVSILSRLSSRIVEEIVSQRELLAAESNELKTQIIDVDALDTVRLLAQTFTRHDLANGGTVQVDPVSEKAWLKTDKTLLQRVVGNMLKNALEAVPSADSVTVGCRKKGMDVEFWVHNPTVMPRDTQLQIFQRSFSTKGGGRGLGTYSMKLLTERYLKGAIGFASSPAAGTRFFASFPVERLP